MEKENVIQRITSKLNLAVQEKGYETEEKIKLSLRVLKQYAMKRRGEWSYGSSHSWAGHYMKKMVKYTLRQF